ncbi:MAG TPA: NAD(P)/FAD-dependent oxidoreductase [Gaiellales bacterium]|nr:NAD(P)/FAD-dependent oxidoreductase [Gaiellales bacterium]
MPADAPTSEPVHDAVVIGGGIAGLSAAWDLRNRDVVVLEGTARLGGRIRSEARDPYWLNLGAHVFSGPGSATGRLVADVGVESVPVPGHLVALELNGRLLVGGRPELYPLRLPLSAAERVALARAGARLRVAVARYERVARPRPGESAAETRRRVLAHGDDRTFADWLGGLPGDADLMFRATVTRSTAEPEEITAGAGTGYFALVWSSGSGLSRNIVGGAGALIDGISAELQGQVVMDAEVQEIAEQGEVVRVRYRAGGADRELRARHAIVATKAYDAARLIRDLPGDTHSALTSIPYGPTVVMAMLTNETRPMPWDDLYALATPKRAFNMLFNTVNVLRPRSAERAPGGSLMVYRAGHAAIEMFEQPDSVVEQAFLDDLYAIYPEARGIVTETILLKLPRMLPYAAPGRSALQPALERPLGRIHLAGDYLGGVYTDTAISSGQEAALAVRTALQAAESRT